MLLLSPVPMVRGFGLLLVAGIAVALVCALTAGSAALVLGERDGGLVGASCAGRPDLVRPAAARGAASSFGRGRAVAARVVAAGGCGAREIVAPAAVAAPVRPTAAVTADRARRCRRRVDRRRGLRRPGACSRWPRVLAVLGWVADTQTAVQSDVTKLVPTTMPALRNLNTLEKVTGVSGRDRRHRARRQRRHAGHRQWMISYENGLLRHYGYVEETRLRPAPRCARRSRCPTCSPPAARPAPSRRR